MKNFLAMLLSLLFFLSFSPGMGCKKAEKSAKPSTSSNWAFIGTFKEVDFYLDFKSVTYDGHIAISRYMHVGKKGEVDIARCSINCEEGTIVFRKHKDTDVDGKPLGSRGDEEQLHWLKIQPNSVWVSFQKSLCKEFAQAKEKAAQEKALPIEEKKTKEEARLKVKPSEKSEVPGSERKTKEVAPDQAAQDAQKANAVADAATIKANEGATRAETAVESAKAAEEKAKKYEDLFKKSMKK